MHKITRTNYEKSPTLKMVQALINLYGEFSPKAIRGRSRLKLQIYIPIRDVRCMFVPQFMHCAIHGSGINIFMGGSSLELWYPGVGGIAAP